MHLCFDSRRFRRAKTGTAKSWTNGDGWCDGAGTCKGNHSSSHLWNTPPTMGNPGWGYGMRTLDVDGGRGRYIRCFSNECTGARGHGEDCRQTRRRYILALPCGVWNAGIASGYLLGGSSTRANLAATARHTHHTAGFTRGYGNAPGSSRALYGRQVRLAGGHVTQTGRSCATTATATAPRTMVWLSRAEQTPSNRLASQR